jgi:uncharacterized protein YdcH (DUF465 family)
MPKPILSHALDKEFPQLADKTVALKKSDARFADWLAQHDRLDAQITEAEEGRVNMDDFTLEDLKKRRLHLKDQLYHKLTH